MNNETRSTEELVAKIRSEFPELKFTDVVPILDKGDDHAVLILDNEWVFRFPKSWAFKISFKQEVAMLDALRSRTRVPVPYYEYLSTEKDFGGYRIIRGVELEPEVYAQLSQVERDTVASDIAQLCSALHSLPTGFVIPIEGDHEDTWSEWYFKRHSLAASYWETDLTRQVDSMFEHYDDMHAPQLCLLHSDLVGEHIYYDLEKRKVAGVIDFGDLSVGDPASDFSYFWSYDYDFPQKMFDAYSGVRDPDFMVRAHKHFIRYEVERVLEALSDKNTNDAERHTALILEHIMEL